MTDESQDDARPDTNGSARGRLLTHPRWTGISGIVAIIALVLTILAIAGVFSSGAAS